MIFFSDVQSRKFGLTSLEDERVGAVLPYIRGKLLDIGAGNNHLVKLYDGDGIGVDIHDLGGEALIIDDTRSIPFNNESFDTITFLASLNHIPYRQDVVKEAFRLLRPGGLVIVTMIGPFIGKVGHFLWRYGEDRFRLVSNGELPGLYNKEIINMLRQEGFVLLKHKRFLLFLNNLIIFQKPY